MPKHVTQTDVPNQKSITLAPAATQIDLSGVTSGFAIVTLTPDTANNTIDSIVNIPDPCFVVIVIAAGPGKCTFKSGTTMKISANMQKAKSGDVLIIMHSGGTCFEVGRSKN